MITIIHGDDVSASRKFFQELKQKQKNLVSLDGNRITITDLIQNIEGSGLFEDKNTIFIENLLTKLKKSDKESKEISEVINKNAKSSTFVLWESREIAKRDLGLFRDTVVHIFKLPKNIFLFLDNLMPGNSKSLINLFHQALDNGIKEELILFMIQRQIRLLLALLDPGSSRIDELVRLAPWQMGKLEKQAKSFNTSELIKIYEKFYELEVAQKTGASSLSLSQNIDILLLDM